MGDCKKSDRKGREPAVGDLNGVSFFPNWVLPAGTS